MIGEDLLLRDFDQCFQQMRYYDEGFRKTLEFSFAGVIAVISAAAAVIGRYGLTAITGGVVTLLGTVSTMAALVLLSWLARNRLYYTIVTRYVNEIRSTYLKSAPAGLKNEAHMYDDCRKPPVYNPRSTQAFAVYVLAACIAVLFAGTVGTIQVTQEALHGWPLRLYWRWLTASFIFGTVIQVEGVFLYWYRADKKVGQEAIWRRKQ
jgi:uncharacterized membrane protein YjgN (DUF898 family)